MDFIGPILSPHRDVIRYMTYFITVSHCIFGFIKIHEFRAMGQCRVEPLLGAIVMAIIQYYKNFMAANDVKASLNLLALLFYSFAMIVFYISGDIVFKCCVRRKVLYTVGIMLVGVAIVFFADERLVAMGIRGLTTLTLAIMLGAPILKLPHIISTKNNQGVPLKAMACGCAVSLLWIMYGLAWTDYAIVNHNIAILCLELIPLLICISFKGKKRPRNQRVNSNNNHNRNNDIIQSNIVRVASRSPIQSPLLHSTSLRRSSSSRVSNKISCSNSTVELSGTIRSSMSLISAISTTGQT